MRGSERFPYHPVVDAINWHGDTLETLVLYDPVGTPTTWRGSVEELTVTAEVVQKLSLRCTRLRALTLYLHFCTDIGLQQSFHQFQALEKLTIYSPLRRAAKEYLEPRVDDAYVSKLAVQVRSPLLREFTLYVGQETPRTSPLYIRHHKWENEHRMVWHVKYPQNDNQDASMMIWESVG